jgi:putative transposase
MREECQQSPFTTVAIVLLPDHLHVMWTLPVGDADYPRRWRAIKARFTSEWLGSGGQELRVTRGYQRQRRRGVWQPRFMEHTIRDEQDLHNHVDYLHYNPVKHGYVLCFSITPRPTRRLRGLPFAGHFYPRVGLLC